VDGFTLALMTPAALDSYLQARYDRQLVRLDKPVRNSYMWLGANRAYYQQHRARVETVWNWLGARGAQEVDALTRRYAALPEPQARRARKKSTVRCQASLAAAAS
jgi:hypothetical protein